MEHSTPIEGILKDALLKGLECFHNPELIGSLLLLYVIHAVGSTINIPHLFLNGLKVIIAPTEDAVRRVRSDAKGPRPEPLGQLDKEGKEANAYDKMNALGLARLEISRGTLGTLMYFQHYESMVMSAIVAVGSFVIAQGSRCAIPSQRPLGWASLTLCIALLRAWWCNVRLIYLLGSGNDHSKFAVLCGFCGLFAAAGVASLFPPGVFAFDLRGAATALHAWGGELASRAVDATTGGGAGEGGGRGRVSEGDFMAMFILAMAVVAACLTAAAALPAIRFAQYLQRVLQPGSGSSFVCRALLVADALLPWLAALVWVAGVPSAFLSSAGLAGNLFGVGVGSAGGGGLGSRARRVPDAEESDAGRLEAAAEAAAAIRVVVTGMVAAVRLVVGRFQLQSYLDGVKESVVKDLREKKVNVRVVCSKFDARFQYLIIAAAQYAAPALTVLLSVAILVHIGGGGRTGDTSMAAGAIGAAAAAAAAGRGLGVCDTARHVVGLRPWGMAFAAAAAESGSGSGNGVANFAEGRGSAAGGLADIFASIPELPRAFWTGFMGFLAWWACLSWAVTYAAGVCFWLLYPEDVSAVERSRLDTTTKSKKRERSGKGKAKAKGGGGGGGTTTADVVMAEELPLDAKKGGGGGGGGGGGNLAAASRKG